MNFEIPIDTNRDRIDENIKEELFENSIKEDCDKDALAVVKEHKFVHDSLFKIKKHDNKTFIHSLEVGNMAAFLINNLEDKLTEREGKILLSSALLHDFGKIFIDKEILNKEESLTAEERIKLEEHPRSGFESVKDWDMHVAKVVAAHHEHQKHSYPRKDVRDATWMEMDWDKEAMKLSRILAIIDSFQSMLDSDRPSNSHKERTIDDVVAELNKEFILNEDKKTIFLLKAYYHKKKGFVAIDASTMLTN